MLPYETIIAGLLCRPTEASTPGVAIVHGRRSVVKFGVEIGGGQDRDGSVRLGYLFQIPAYVNDFQILKQLRNKIHFTRIYSFVYTVCAYITYIKEQREVKSSRAIALYEV